MCAVCDLAHRAVCVDDYPHALIRALWSIAFLSKIGAGKRHLGVSNRIAAGDTGPEQLFHFSSGSSLSLRARTVGASMNIRP
jgi:hypothetical protein